MIILIINKDDEDDDVDGDVGRCFSAVSVTCMRHRSCFSNCLYLFNIFKFSRVCQYCGWRSRPRAIPALLL